jgi:hypothetical protein
LHNAYKWNLKFQRRVGRVLLAVMLIRNGNIVLWNPKCGCESHPIQYHIFVTRATVMPLTMQVKIDRSNSSRASAPQRRILRILHVISHRTRSAQPPAVSILSPAPASQVMRPRTNICKGEIDTISTFSMVNCNADLCPCVGLQPQGTVQKMQTNVTRRSPCEYVARNLKWFSVLKHVKMCSREQTVPYSMTDHVLNKFEWVCTGKLLI